MQFIEKNKRFGKHLLMNLFWESYKLAEYFFL